MTSRYNADVSDDVITWMKDGSHVLTSFGGQTQINFPNPIQTSDQGIYEIYYDNERNQNRGGLYRLIVRAKFISSDELFTKTVHVNETGVMISMTSRYNADVSDDVITWMKDGSHVLTSFGGQTQINFPNPIQTSDQGIYEIYYDNERNQNRGGLYRLIVRECPAGKWGPPECYSICEKCFNGGICHDKSGLCICPNNFKGPNCLEKPMVEINLDGIASLNVHPGVEQIAVMGYCFAYLILMDVHVTLVPMVLHVPHYVLLVHMVQDVHRHVTVQAVVRHVIFIVEYVQVDVRLAGLETTVKFQMNVKPVTMDLNALINVIALMMNHVRNRLESALSRSVL
eukprot:XP_011661879.1 PREDICTED: uncharacterized protein LOC105437226 [Strongylocentrotus purpuratus]